MYKLIWKMLPIHNSIFSVGAKKTFWAWSVRVQNCLECKTSVAHLAAMIFLALAAYHIMQRNTTRHDTFYPNSQWLLFRWFPRGCVSAQLSYLWEATRHLVDPTCHLDFQPPGGNWPSPCYSSDHLRHQSLKLWDDYGSQNPLRNDGMHYFTAIYRTK